MESGRLGVDEEICGVYTFVLSWCSKCFRCVEAVEGMGSSVAGGEKRSGGRCGSG